jgi:DNA helicase INO80
MQAHDAAKAQDCARTAQAAVRNAFSQRNLKPTYRSSTKANKEAVAKGKKVMREMLVYWKKNEKEELAARKRAEKEALEKAKAEEEAREAKRQSRKLNFLLTQTELYSHFIGKKIKTNEAENMDGDTVTPSAPAPVGAEHEDGGAEPLKDLDYDDDDDENLRRHAARGAQAAIQANRERAAQFDATAKQQNGLDDDTMDGDELNFQNPSLGDNSVTITQPKMLMAQLKEYQLKGLTWLGNLYEQGINGILADEMGLGKTIQSISLLAYLAESHNLWGPFLVIAPASTLHNWQQELVRFVPRLKALPYWGSPKDRETLRRIWNKKNQTFSEDSPFHILVTSYQLAVQDEKYFHGMKWQYMVLDEAQAIKSASSARWKSLLSIDCRNRLLLTGTPIQNSMHGEYFRTLWT